jgi:hypothetical protein
MVDIKIITATPEEIAGSRELQELLRRFAGSSVTGAPQSQAPGQSVPADEGAELLPAHVRAFITERAPNDTERDLMLRFVEEQVATGHAQVSIGTSRKRADGKTPYLMLHARGPRLFGAYAYLRPSNAGLTLRLPPDAAEGYRLAHVRNVHARQTYAVTCPLRSAGALKEATDLAAEALRRVTKR